MSHHLANLLLVAIASLAAVSAHSETFIPMPPQGAIGLGSGVNILNPGEAIPSCFTYDPQPLDTTNAARSYTAYLKAVGTIEEVNRMRTRGAQVGATFGTVTAKLESWNAQESKEKTSGLYVLIEARSVGPRQQATNIRPREDVKELLSSGSPEGIFGRCGSHIAVVQHTGQAIRVVINLRTADSVTKEQIGAKFGAKAKFGPFSSDLGGNYQATVQRLAGERRLQAEVEGSGIPINPSKILELLKANGDFDVLAESLNQIVADTKFGDPQPNVAYGFSLQPLYYYAPAASPFKDAGQALAAIDRSMEYSTILESQVNLLTKERAIAGIPAARQAEIAAEITNLRAMIAAIRGDLIGCLVGGKPSAGTCEDLAEYWGTKILEGRGLKVELVSTEDSIILTTSVPIRSKGLLVVAFGDEKIALEPLSISSGEQKTILIKVLKPLQPEPRFPGFPPGMDPFIVKPNKSDIATTTPLLFTSAIVAWAIEGNAGLPKANIAKAYFGCHGVAIFENQTRPAVYLLVVAPTRVTTLPIESVCSPHFSPLNGPIVRPHIPIPVQLMPFGLAPLEINEVPNRPVQLLLILEDAVGFESVHILSHDLAKAIDPIAKKLGY